MTEYASRGDPRRSMELLWGVETAPTRGPKPGLAVADDRRRRRRAGRRRGARRRLDAQGRRAPGQERDGPLHLRARQGRAARPDARHRARRAADRRTRSTTAGGPPPRRGPRTAGTSTSAIPGSCRCRQPRPCSARTSSTPTRPCCGSSTGSACRRRAGPVGRARWPASCGARPRRCPTPAPPSRRRASATTTGGTPARRCSTSSSATTGRALPDARRGSRPSRPSTSSTAPDDSMPYTVRDAFDTFEFGLQRLLDGFAAHIAAVGGS